MLVSAKCRADFHVAVDGILNLFLSRAEQGKGLDLSAALAHSENGSLTYRTSSLFQLVGFVLIALQSADERLVNLHDPAQLVAVLTASLAEPLEHEPCRLLSDANLFGQLERRDSLAGRNYQIHRINPLVKRNVRPLEDRSSADGEVQLAWVAAVIAVLARGDALFALALRALDAVGPQTALKVRSGPFPRLGRRRTVGRC